jgi:hypothetical protein
MQQPQQPTILSKRDQGQTLINILGALDALKINGSEAPLLVQIKQGLEVILYSINDELTREAQKAELPK